MATPFQMWIQSASVLRDSSHLHLNQSLTFALSVDFHPAPFWLAKICSRKSLRPCRNISSEANLPQISTLSQASNSTAAGSGQRLERPAGADDERQQYPF